MLPRMPFLSKEEAVTMDRGAGSRVVNKGHDMRYVGFSECKVYLLCWMVAKKESSYSIVALCVGLCSQLTICEHVKEFIVCCQSGNQDAFTE